MKTLIDLTSLADNFSGIELYAMSVTQELIKNKNNRYILVFNNKVHEAFCEEYENVEKIVLKSSNKLIFNQLILPLRLRKVHADRYLFMAFTEPFFWLKRNTINTIHDVSCWDCPGSNKKHMILYWKIMFRKVASRKGKILTVSNFSKKRITEILKVDPKRIIITYSAPLNEVANVKCDFDKYETVRKKYALPLSFFLCLSTLEPRKNLKLFLKAYSDLVLEGSVDEDVVLAGRKGWMVEDLLNELDESVKKKIYFTGFVENEDLPYIYNAAVAFVFPSLYEGFGVPPLEAIAQNTIVISSNAASLPEVLGNAAIFFENNNLDDLKNKILDVKQMSESEKLRLVDNGTKVLKRYQWPIISKHILDIIS